MPHSKADEEPLNDKVVYQVDHKNNQLTISDITYTMPINLKVYIFDSKKGVRRKANRYALKPGQVVFFYPKARKQVAYIDTIEIFK